MTHVLGSFRVFHNRQILKKKKIHNFIFADFQVQTNNFKCRRIIIIQNRYLQQIEILECEIIIVIKTGQITIQVIIVGSRQVVLIYNSNYLNFLNFFRYEIHIFNHAPFLHIFLLQHSKLFASRMLFNFPSIFTTCYLIPILLMQKNTNQAPNEMHPHEFTFKFGI